MSLLLQKYEFLYHNKDLNISIKLVLLVNASAFFSEKAT